MKRIFCFLIVLSTMVFISSYIVNFNVIADEEKIAEEKQKSSKKTTAKDRVCGMEVQKDKALKVEYEGKTYYFCSKGCEETFKNEPSKYQKTGKKEKEEKTEGN